MITTETQKVMNGGKVKKIPCDKPIAGGILKLVDAKINHLFNAEEDTTSSLVLRLQALVAERIERMSEHCS